MKASLLTYDIPEDATFIDPRTGRERPFPNVVPALRSIGIHLELSAWILRSDTLPYALISRIRALPGGKCHVVNFAIDEEKAFIEMAIESIRKNIRESMANTEKSIAAANVKADGDVASPAVDAAAAKKAFARRTGATMRRLNRVLKDLRSAAATFGISEDAVGLNTANNAVESFNAAIKRRCDLMMDAAKALRANGPGSTGEGLANAIEMDACPAYIAADALEELTDGNTDTANAIRTAFEEAYVEPTEADEDGVFDLSTTD